MDHALWCGGYAMIKKPYSPPQVVTRSSAISPEKRARIVALREEGLSVEVIAQRLGLHRNTVTKWSVRLGALELLECTCGRRVRLEERCYVCRGHRERIKAPVSARRGEP